MRLFTPTAACVLHAQRAVDDYKELYQSMHELVVGDEGPRPLGVMLPCGRTYATLADLDCDDAKRTRLLFALLDARILVAALRAAVKIARLDYPGDLGRLLLAPAMAIDVPSGLHVPCTGAEAHAWATQLEASVCDAIDSFGPIEEAALEGHGRILSLSLVNADSITIDAHRVAEHVLILLDDVHKLAPKQRGALIEDIMAQRASVGVWVAERFESLPR